MESSKSPATKVTIEGNDVRIDGPFASLTKAQMIDILAQARMTLTGMITQITKPEANLGMQGMDITIRKD